MKRRDFLKTATAAGIGLTLPWKDILSHGGSLLAAQPAPQGIDIVSATGNSPSAIVRAAVNALGGMNHFISKGDVVVVKPNMGWDRTPEFAANTNPEVVATVVKMCFEAGAKTVKVFDRTCNDPRRCYVQSGVEDAARKAGAEVTQIDERKFKTVQIPNGKILKSWPLYSELFEANKIINVPIAKHHGLSKLTLCHKNWMGMMGGKRGQIHQNIGDALVDLTTVIKPCLNIVDAIRILTNNGPSGGSLSDVKTLNTIIAGVNQVSVDAYAATLFGLTGSDIPYIRAGAERGTGVMDLSKLSIKKIAA